MQRLLSVLMASLFALVACAAETPTASVDLPDGLRVLVQLAPDAKPGGSPDERPAAIEQRARQSSGVPVRYLAASGARWHALALLCPASECDAALQRLSGDRANFLVVQRDELRRR